MINAHLRELSTPNPGKTYGPDNIVAGEPITALARLQSFSPDQWEKFVEEWAEQLKPNYARVLRYSGPGDKGVDIAGFKTDRYFQAPWDCYQCKYYDHPLTPTDIQLEAGKIIYYSFSKEYIPPDQYYFLPKKDVGLSAKKLLTNPDNFKNQLRDSWPKVCATKITASKSIPLEGELLAFFDLFNFSIFTWKKGLDLVKEHSKTKNHIVKFGGGLPPRPLPPDPPTEPTTDELNYISKIIEAYSQYLKRDITSKEQLPPDLQDHLYRQRIRFNCAEYLKAYARDRVPSGTFELLQDDIYYGIIEICEDTSHADGFVRLNKTMSHAPTIQTTSNPLNDRTDSKDRQGICHQLVDRGRIVWVKK